MVDLLCIFLCIQPLFAYHTHISNNGSGSFGDWRQDSNNNNNFYNLPYYHYTLDQINNKTATIYNSSTIYQKNQKYEPYNNITDHLFQFGNDRVTVVASNYGYIQIRMDSTGPKFLNDFNRNNNQYGAGLGYIVNKQTNKLLLSTFYTGYNQNISIERDYSFYYRKYQATSNDIALEQTLMVPFGNDPIVISKITINNTNTNNKYNLSYFEFYGGAMYQMVYHHSQQQRRQYQSDNYNVSYSTTNNNKTMSATYIFTGKPVHITGEPNGWLFDQKPPKTFLSVIGNSDNINININWGCDSNTFFGEYGVENPIFNVDNNCNNINYSSLIIEISNITKSNNQFYL
eukprot:414380_1